MPETGGIKGNNYECFFLEWDTDYFGINSAKVNLLGPVGKKEQDEILKFCEKYDFVTISNLNNVKENNFWIGNKTDAYLVDMNIQLIKTLKEIPKNVEDTTYISNNSPRNRQINEIAKKSFQYSRFFNDTNLSANKTKNIYHQWVENSFDRENKYFVICERNKEIAGFLLFSIKDNFCEVELIAVEKAHQGKGVGKSLIFKLESYIFGREIKEIKVGTQVNNYSALNFYTSLGFKYTNTSSTYHLWNK